jgi:hypothetical protein
MPTAMKMKDNGEWEVFDYDDAVNKYVIEECDAASDAVEVLKEVAAYDKTYEEGEDDE